MTEWKQSNEATKKKAESLYAALVMLSETPGEAAEIITMLYVNLWLMGGAVEEGSLDRSLQGFTDCVKLNVTTAQSQGMTKQ